MILYNVTVNIDPQVHDEWLDWMRNVHIPDVLKTGLFTDNKLFRVLSVEENEGYTYSIQYFLKSMDDYETYRQQFAAKLQAEFKERYEGKFAAFRTLLELC